MKRSAFFGVAVVALVLAFGSAAYGAAFTSGNIVVSRVGDGSGALTNAATAVFLDEYTPAGVLVQSIPMPTTASGSNKRFTNSGSATSEGALTLSTDGRYLTLAGYDAATGTASIASTTSANNNRVVAVVGMSGSIDTTTALSDAYSANNIRSAVYDPATGIWTGGPGTGVRFTTFGGTTSTQLSTGLTNTRVVNVANGQLYTSSASGAFQGVSSVGSGLPTSSGQTVTLLSGFPTASGPSAYDFCFADASTLYVADDRTNGNGGIQKWTLNAGTWTLAYTLASATNVGARGLTSDGTALLATTTDNKLVMVTDTGVGSAFTTLVTGATNTALRGVEFTPTPEPATLMLLAAAGAMCWRRRR